MAERASINQKLQFGVESTPGTSVAATKSIQCFNFVTGVKAEVTPFRATGHRWPSTAVENREWTEFKIDGTLDYQGFVYLVSSVWGAATITLHTAGTLSHDWTWTPAIANSITPVTYTVEQGDSVRAHKATYGQATGFGYKISRHSTTSSGAMIGQLLQDGITMTGSPTAIALAPVMGKHVNVYMDTTSGGIGTTQLTRAFELEYSYDGGFGSFWPLNRTNTSFGGTVDLPPKNMLKWTVEADATGMSSLTHLQAGDYLYVRVDAQGAIIEGAIRYEMIHDMAIKVTNVTEFKDQDGIFGIGYEADIMEDGSWSSGQAQKLIMTNILTAL